MCTRAVEELGERVSGTSKCFADVALESIPAHLRKPLTGLLEAINSLTEQILVYDKQIEEAASRYPVVERMTTIPCVGTLTALSFVLTVEDPQRLTRSRLAGCFFGLRPKNSQSGEGGPQMGVSQNGDGELRTLMGQGAHLL